MKMATLQIGTREGKDVEVNVRLADTVADCLEIEAGNEKAIATRYNRGRRIWLQDAIGRPMFKAGKTLQEIQAACDNAKAGDSMRSTSKTPTSIELPKTRDGKLDLSTIEGILAKHGINVTVA